MADFPYLHSFNDFYHGIRQTFHRCQDVKFVQGESGPTFIKINYQLRKLELTNWGPNESTTATFKTLLTFHYIYWLFNRDPGSLEWLIIITNIWLTWIPIPALYDHYSSKTSSLYNSNVAIRWISHTFGWMLPWEANANEIEHLLQAACAGISLLDSCWNKGAAEHGIIGSFVEFCLTSCSKYLVNVPFVVGH